MTHFNPSQLIRPSRGERRPLLSVYTILILSGFLLGMSLGNQLSGEMRVLVSISGLAGLVAFVGLDHVASRRRQQQERTEQEYIYNRLVKHVISMESAAIDHEELMSLAREATAAMELEELVPAG